MIKHKVTFGWILKSITSVAIVCFLFLAPLTVMPSLLAAQSNINRVKQYGYQGILELWHIETFEGGSVSRAAFLEKQCVAFEKQNKGTYIVVKTMSPEQLNLNLQNNNRPNLISFGIGVGDQFVDSLCALNFADSIRPDLLVGGKFNGSQLALPYMLGGYAVICQNKAPQNTTMVGVADFTNPVKASVLNKLNLQFAKNINFDSYTAYDKFLKAGHKNLLGTQRDVYRVNNRVSKGMLTDISYQFLTEYTDLVQYVSVFKTDAKQQQICTDFVRFLISAASQQKLANINMFSVLQNMCLYTDNLFGQMEKSLSKNLHVENVFLSTQAINLEKNKYLTLAGE